MFDKIRSALRRKEKEATYIGLKNRLQYGQNQITKSKDLLEHEKEKLESEIEAAMTRADHLKTQGKMHDAIRFVYESREKDKALRVIYKALDSLSVYGTKMSILKSRVTAKSAMQKALLHRNILDKNTVELAERSAVLEEKEEVYDNMDIERLEKALDTPFYSPATHDKGYQATVASLETMSGSTSFFQRYLDSFRSDLVKLDDKK